MKQTGCMFQSESGRDTSATGHKRFAIDHVSVMFVHMKYRRHCFKTGQQDRLL